MTQEYSILANIKLLESDPRSPLGVIFTVRDGSFTEFEISLLATNGRDNKLVFGISDAVGMRKTWPVRESEETKKPFYIFIGIRKNGETAEIEIRLNNKVIFKGVEEFLWPINLNPKIILGSPVGGSFPCKISEVVAYDRYLDDIEINTLSDYLKNKENNQTFAKSMELGLGKYVELKK